MSGEVSYLEIGAQNAEASCTFFEQLFGWRFHPMGNNGEGWFQTPSIKAGLHGQDSEPQISIFFDVPDLMAAISKVQELGGEAEQPGPEEAGFGRFCSCRDPQGVRFGLHQPPTA